MGALFSPWLVHPLLFAAGAMLVSLPVIIHLLNKRRFRIVDWAAMDFLLEADLRNRRRIQLEELILLALRCAAVLLAGLLVARPFWPGSLPPGWLQSVRYERIVLLDDSPSMEAAEAGRTPFDEARRQIADLVAASAERGTGDSLTLVLTSRPGRPVLMDVPLNAQTAAGILAELDGLATSDLSSRLERACAEVHGLLGAKSDKINRVVYVLSDLRNGDWLGESPQPDQLRDEGAPEHPAMESLRKLSAETAGCFVVDVGNEANSNLSIVGVSPEDKVLLAGVSARFNVSVRNHGPETLRDVPIRFLSGGSLPLTAVLESVPAGGTAAVPFSYTFGDHDPGYGDEPPEPVSIRAELAARPAGDALAADDVAFYAARVQQGIPTLLVDGDASAEYGESETFFLQRALAPPGLVASGIQVETIGDAEFEAHALAPYQVVHLCNVYRLSEQRRRSLEDWVSGGGGLVVWPGAQVDVRHYRDELYREGAGLLPAPLKHIAGDEAEQTWASFRVAEPQHPSLRVFEGDAAPWLESAKLFQWWVVAAATAGGATPATVVLALNDAERSPALLEKPFGRGRVVQMALPADVAWSNWPEDASYVIFLQDLNRYLAQTVADPGSVTVGEPLLEQVDIARFRAEAQITRPDGQTVTRRAVPGEGEPAASPTGSGSPWLVKYDEADRRGFYNVQLTRGDGRPVPLLTAANLSPQEGNLRRADADVLRRAWNGTTVQLVRGESLASLLSDGSKAELWTWVLMALVSILFIEQVLAWTLGRSR